MLVRGLVRNHAGLFWLTQRKHCAEIRVQLAREFCEPTVGRWVFRSVGWARWSTGARTGWMAMPKLRFAEQFARASSNREKQARRQFIGQSGYTLLALPWNTAQASDHYSQLEAIGSYKLLQTRRFHRFHRFHRFIIVFIVLNLSDNVPFCPR